MRMLFYRGISRPIQQYFIVTFSSFDAHMNASDLCILSYLSHWNLRPSTALLYLFLNAIHTYSSIVHSHLSQTTSFHLSGSPFHSSSFMTGPQHFGPNQRTLLTLSISHYTTPFLVIHTSLALPTRQLQAVIKTDVYY